MAKEKPRTQPLRDGIRTAIRFLTQGLEGWQRLRRFKRAQESGRSRDLSLGHISSQLNELNRATEQDFLRVGGELMELRSNARRIASEIAEMIGLVSGDEGNRLSLTLAGILDHSRDMDSLAAAGGAAQARIHELSPRIPGAFVDLRSRVMLFRSLCTLIRIETSRLGHDGSGFEGLAEAVRPLSDHIHLCGERVLTASVRLDEHIRSALSSGATLQNRWLADLRSLIQTVTGSLHSFEERRNQAVQTSLRQAEQYAAITRAIDSLVQSLQVHDITRQQVEHVAESLSRIDEEGHTRGGFGGIIPPQTGAVLKLQGAQLSSAESAFTQSVRCIQDGLQDIATRTHQMGQETEVLLGFSTGEGNPFFDQMEHGCADILKIIGNTYTANVQVRAIGTEIIQTVTTMLQSVADIRDLEIQIQRIAINATIRAIQIGPSGNALNSIADAMQRTVLDSSRSTEAAAEALELIRAAAVCLAGEGSETRAIQQSEGALKKMREDLSALTASAGGSAIRVGKIVDTGAELEARIHTILAGFTAGETFSSIAGKAREDLGAIAGEIEPISGELGGQLPAENLDSYALHYTMQSERDVHQGAAAADLIYSPPASGQDLGDNVELF